MNRPRTPGRKDLPRWFRARKKGFPITAQEVRESRAELLSLRAQLADWQNLFAAVVGQSLPGAPMRAEQMPAKVAK